MIFIERVEDEYYVRIGHSMTKEHYISFIAAASSDNMQIVKLYPEGKKKEQTYMEEKTVILEADRLLNDDHKGGCVLYEKQAQVETLLSK